MIEMGTEIKIKSLDWYNKYSDNLGNIRLSDNTFTKEMKKFLGETALIEKYIGNNNYRINIDGGCWNWTPEMFEIIKEKYKGEVFRLGEFYVIVNLKTKEIQPILYDTEEEAYSIIKENEYRR